MGKEKEVKLVPDYQQKYEYKVHDYEKPYRDYGNKERIINEHAMQGWELVSSVVIPMGILDDTRIIDGEEKKFGRKVWCIEQLYFRREMKEKGESDAT